MNWESAVLPLIGGVIATFAGFVSSLVLGSISRKHEARRILITKLEEVHGTAHHITNQVDGIISAVHSANRLGGPPGSIKPLPTDEAVRLSMLVSYYFPSLAQTHAAFAAGFEVVSEKASKVFKIIINQNSPTPRNIEGGSIEAAFSELQEAASNLRGIRDQLTSSAAEVSQQLLAYKTLQPASRVQR